jgi:hypothetical protein
MVTDSARKKPIGLVGHFSDFFFFYCYYYYYYSDDDDDDDSNEDITRSRD